MDRILIRDLLVRGIVGVNEEERRERQDVLINVELRVDTRAAAGSDDLAQSVNYRSVAKRLVAHVEGGRPLLVERLADELARIVLTEFPVSSLRLRVEKPGALRFARSVGVEIERSAEDYGGGGA
jgi:FolB domain-containing protein